LSYTTPASILFSVEIKKNIYLEQVLMNLFTIKSTSALGRRMRFIGAMLVVALMMPAIAFSQPYSNPSPVPLGRASTYWALASTGITGSAKEWARVPPAEATDLSMRKCSQA
jgi:hypothetical protein